MPHEKQGGERTWVGVSTPDDTGDEAARPDQTTTSTMDRARETASDTLDQARDKAMEGAEQAREGAAEGMQTAAQKIREKAGTDGLQAKAGTTLADGMEKTAGYLREHDTQEIMNDVEIFVREHPTQSVLGAVVVGFILGRMMR